MGERNWGVMGVQTKDADAPTGSASYKQSLVVGQAIRGNTLYDLKDSTLDLMYDFSSFAIDVKLNVIGTPGGGGANVVFGSYTQDTLYNAFRGYFAGFLKREGGERRGEIVGRFFGPGAAELGVSFSIADGFDAAGVVVAKKQ